MVCRGLTYVCMSRSTWNSPSPFPISISPILLSESMKTIKWKSYLHSPLKMHLNSLFYPNLWRFIFRVFTTTCSALYYLAVNCFAYFPTHTKLFNCLETIPVQHHRSLSNRLWLQGPRSFHWALQTKALVSTQLHHSVDHVTLKISWQL